MIKLLVVIYLIVGVLIASSTSRGIKVKMPFVVSIMVCIFWFPLMFVCVCSVIVRRITRKNRNIAAIELSRIIKEIKKDAWKN